MRVVQATYGVFHSFELAKQMHARGYLKRIYTTWLWRRVEREGLPRACVVTFPWLAVPDYLLGRTRVYPEVLSQWVKRINALAFDNRTRRSVPACDVFVGISGAGLLTALRVQERGGKYVCDRGSTHQRHMDAVLRAEFLRWGLEAPRTDAFATAREEACYAAADTITVPSHVAMRSFVERGVAAEKLKVIPYGVRLERFRKIADSPTGSFEVLFVGQVGLRKGVPYLLEAFARLRHPRKRLTIVGALQRHILPLLPRLPQDAVRFLGSMPQGEVAELMSRSHVLVLPSVEEGMALVMAQAMACGCPVIATEATGAEDLFTDGVEGFIVPDRDVAGLALRMQEVADDPGLRERMAAAALTRVQSVGGWDAYGSAWDAMMQELAGGVAEQS